MVILFSYPTLVQNPIIESSPSYGDVFLFHSNAKILQASPSYNELFSYFILMQNAINFPPKVNNSPSFPLCATFPLWFSTKDKYDI